MSSDGDNYVFVSGTLKAEPRPKAIFFKSEESGETSWIPRSLLHAADDKAIDEVAVGSPLTVRVREWFAEKEGLI